MIAKNWGMITCMKEFGGSFVKALSGCLEHADSINYRKLKKAFPKYFEEYITLLSSIEDNKEKNEH